MSYTTLARKESYTPAGKTKAAKGSASSLRISDPNDAYEREADEAAEAVLSDRRLSSWSLSKVKFGQIQRQASGNQPSPEPNNYKEAAGKLAEAFLKTDVGKKLTDASKNDPLVKGAEDFVGTLPGKIIAGAAAAGAVSAMAVTHTALPAQIPEIPLDKIRPGLSVKITYEGPVDRPTKAAITFSYTPKGEDKKPKQTESERYRAETARIAAEQEKFRAGMKYKPGSAEDLQQKAEQKAIEGYTLHRLGALPGTVGQPLVPTYPALKRPPDTGLRLPSVESPFKAKPFHLLDKQLELKPITSSSEPTTEEKKKEETAPIQRKGSKETCPQVPAAVDEVLRFSGTPLDSETRRLMQSRIGFDFTNVRVHTDSRAAASAEAMNATAYTVGRDIVFAPGHYSPHCTEGRKLLAHELAHTVQQREHAAVRVAGLPISNDATAEREADHTAERIATGHRLWPVTTSTARALQRKCACGGSGDECEECKKKKLLQRKPSVHSAPHVAPPIVHSVLNSSGSPLDRATRTFFEPRFGMDLGNVRIHDDSHAAKSAEVVNAHAYTVGNSIVFGAGRYRPDNAEGRRLLAHELTHVVHQRGATDRLVQREEVETVEGPKTGSLIERAFDAADATHWQEAAELANGLSPSDLKAFIAALGGGWKIEQLHIGAINNPRVGPNSAIAKITRWAYLNAKFAEQMKGGFYQAASEYLNGFSPAEIRARVGKLKTEVVAGLHNGAVAQAGIGPESNAAKITAEELDKRKEKGDAAADAATKPVAVEGPLEKKKRCQDTGGQGFKIFPLRLPKGMWQLSNAPITAERKGDEILVKQPFNEVKGDSMFRRETKTLPLDTFLGGIRLKKDDVVGVRLYDDKERLVCVTGEEMLKFSDATDMALWLSVGRTALDAATIIAPGASAGIGKATAYGVGNIALGQALEVGRQEMEVHYGLREEVDWGGIAFETAFQLATLGFSKYLNNAATKAVLGKAPELGQKPVQLIIQSAIQGGTGLVHTAARTAFDLLRNQKKKFVMEEFLEQLATEFTTGALFAFVSGAAHHEEGLLQQKKAAPVEHEQGAPAPPVHEETPAPQATAQKTTTAKVDEHPLAAMPQKKGGEEKTGTPPAAHEETPTPVAQSQKKAAARAEEHAPPVPEKETTPAVEGGVTEEPAAAVSNDKKKVRASEKTEDGRHDVVVTDEGVGVCSPPPCPVIRVEYKKELKTNPELKQWEKIVQGLRKTNPDLAAGEGKKLIAALEEARANGGTLSPDVAARHRKAMLESRITAGEAELNIAREATLKYQAGRKAADESLKGGPSKRIWNLKESIWVAKRQMQNPNRTILEQATIVGVKGPDGKLTTTKSLAGSGRIADYVELRDSKVVAGDIKSAEEFTGSIAGGVTDAQRREAEFRASSKIAKQQAVEAEVLNAAQIKGTKIVISGRDVTTGKKVTMEVDAASYGSEVVTYQDPSPN